MSGGCIFCDIVAGRAPASIAWQDDTCIAFMDLFPVSDGHVLVVPRRHAALVGELPAAERAHLLEVACRIMAAQQAAGFQVAANNLLVNDGKAANQHVPHVHLHVIPRRGGDLGGILRRFATRFLNPFGLEARRRRLDAQAQRLATALRR